MPGFSATAGTYQRHALTGFEREVEILHQGSRKRVVAEGDILNFHIAGELSVGAGVILGRGGGVVVGGVVHHILHALGQYVTHLPVVQVEGCQQVTITDDTDQLKIRAEDRCLMDLMFDQKKISVGMMIKPKHLVQRMIFTTLKISEVTLVRSESSWTYRLLKTGSTFADLKKYKPLLTILRSI